MHIQFGKKLLKHIGFAVAAIVVTSLLSMKGNASENTADIPSAPIEETEAVPSASVGDAETVPSAPIGDAEAVPSEASGDATMSSDVHGSDSPADAMEVSTAPPAADNEESPDILSVKLPVVAEEEPSPFDFIIDPSGLLYETGAVLYGGGTVEEGATMLFHNKEGEYMFSRYSDKLAIINEDEVPVIVTVSAFVSDLEEVALAEQDDFSDNMNLCIYLALVDDLGNRQPIFQDAKAELCMRLDPGAAYSFGLVGACNPDADWQEVSFQPKVRVTWDVKPVQEETDEHPETGEDDVPSDKDTIESEPGQEDLGEPPADNAPAQSGETQEGSDSESVSDEEEDPSQPARQENTPEQDGPDDVPEIPDIGEEPGNLPEDLGTGEDNIHPGIEKQPQS